MKHAGLVKELCKCPKVDTNFIDSTSKRYLYDLAAESGFHYACLQMENAFLKHQGGSLKSFHARHEYQVQFATQHQLRSVWLNFVDDPRGAFTLSGHSNRRLKCLPNQEDWKVYVTPEMHDCQDGWIQSFLADSHGLPLAVNWNLSRLVHGNAIFNGIDNYRFRHLTRVIKKN